MKKIIATFILALSILVLQNGALSIKGINLFPILADKEIADCYDRGMPFAYYNFKYYEYIIGDLNVNNSSTDCFNIKVGKEIFIPLFINFVFWFVVFYIIIWYNNKLKNKWPVVILGIVFIYLLWKYWQYFEIINFY